MTRTTESGSLAGLIGLVTGASAGIGRAVALELARRGVSVWLLARQLPALEEVAGEMRDFGGNGIPLPVDLTDDGGVERAVHRVASEGGVLDILVHCAAAHALGSISETPASRLDALYRLNVRAPYLLSQLLLPALRTRGGQIVFVNSSVGVTTRACVGPYAATKHALRAIADTLRTEVNAEGMRVLSVFVGRTATPGQAAIHAQEGKPYHPDRLLQPRDVAVAVADALGMPRTAEVTDVHVRPLKKP